MDIVGNRRRLEKTGSLGHLVISFSLLLFPAVWDHLSAVRGMRWHLPSSSKGDPYLLIFFACVLQVIDRPYFIWHISKLKYQQAFTYILIYTPPLSEPFESCIDLREFNHALKYAMSRASPAASIDRRTSHMCDETAQCRVLHVRDVQNEKLTSTVRNQSRKTK